MLRHVTLRSGALHNISLSDGQCRTFSNLQVCRTQCMQYRYSSRFGVCLLGVFPDELWAQILQI